MKTTKNYLADFCREEDAVSDCVRGVYFTTIACCAMLALGFWLGWCGAA